MNLQKILQAAISNPSVLLELGLIRTSKNYEELIATIDLIQPVQTLSFDLNSVISFTNPYINSVPRQYLYFDTSDYCYVESGTYLGAPYQNLKYIQYLANKFLYIIGENNAWLYKTDTKSYFHGISTETEIVLNSGFGICGSDNSNYVYIGALWNDSGTIKPVIYQYDIENNQFNLLVPYNATNSPTIALLPKRVNAYYDPNVSEQGGFRLVIIYDHIIYTCTYNNTTSSWGTLDTIFEDNYQFVRNCIIASYQPLVFWALVDWRIHKIQLFDNNYLETGIIHEDMLMNGEPIGLYIDVFSDPSINNAYVVTDSHEIISFNKTSGIPINSFGHFGKDRGNSNPAALWGQVSGTIMPGSVNTIFIADNRNMRITAFIDTEMPEEQVITVDDFSFGTKVQIKRIYPTGLNIENELSHFTVEFSDGTRIWEYRCDQEININVDKLVNMKFKYHVDNMYISNWKFTGYKIEYKLPLT